MVELLLHFAVPFAALRTVRLGWREALFTSIIALLPDLIAQPAKRRRSEKGCFGGIADIAGELLRGVIRLLGLDSRNVRDLVEVPVEGDDLFDV